MGSVSALRLKLKGLKEYPTKSRATQRINKSIIIPRILG